MQGKGSLCDECLTGGKEVRIIDREHLNRDPANCRSCDHLGSGPREVLGPLVLPRVEQPHDLPGNRIASGNIRALVPIAVQASQGEIFETGGPPMLLRHDVIDMEWQRVSRRREPTVFAAAGGSAPNLPDQFLVHQLGPAGGFRRRATLALDCNTASRFPTCR